MTLNGLQVFQTSEAIGGASQPVNQKGTPYGAAFSADWLVQMALQGRIFMAATGTATTPVTFKTGFTLLQPELAVDCPSTAAILPVSLGVYLETSAGTINEVVLQSTTTALGAGTSTAVTIAPSGRTDAPVTSACSAYSLYSANGAAQSNIREIWRSGYAFADVTAGPIKKFEADIRHNLIPHWVVGVGGLQVYVGATSSAATGYIKLHYLEVPVAFAKG